MAAPVLNAYEYQFKDNGMLINGSAALPFIDVNKVAGLDMPNTDGRIVELDSRHGGYGFSRYTNVRTIVIDGVLYAAPTTIDVTTDALKTNFAPDDIEYPFYFRGAGVAQRYIMCKSLGVRYDIERLRSYGACNVQFQLFAGDPRAYVNNADQAMVAGTLYTPANGGNVETYPIITIVGAFTAITLTNQTTGKSVVLTTTRVAGDVTVVDFLKRNVTVNGVRMSGVVTTRGWWNIAAGGGNQVKYTVAGGPPTSVTLATKQGYW